MRQLLLARGGDVVYCDPWVPEVELDGRPPPSVEWTARRGRARRLRRVLTPHRQFLEEPLWDARAPGRRRANVVPRRARRPPDLVAAPMGAECAIVSLLGGAGTSAPRLGGARRSADAATRSCSRTTGTRPTASQLAGLEERGARVETADIRSRGGRRAAARASRRPRLPARRAGEPADLRARARLHGGDERDRRPARRRGGRSARGPPSSSPARSTSTETASTGEVGPTRRTARRATSRT